MSDQILCLSGWGQKFDSLEFIFKESNFDPFFVSSLDYSSFDDARACLQTTQGKERLPASLRGSFYTSDVGKIFPDNKVSGQNFALSSDKNSSRIEAGSLKTGSRKFFSFVESKKLNPKILVGWSLGGQLAIRLIAQKILNPKLLVLIAPPFQMIKDSRVQAGMSMNTFKEFRENFVAAPTKTLKQFSILTAMNDRNASEIARTLDVNEDNFENLIYWLDELKRFSCFDVDFSNMPRTIFFQGVGDMIVHESQAKYFAERIKNFRLEIFRNCGHAPQLNDVERVREVILEEIATILSS
ncbi:MAG: alpha/beta hydrolase [Rickettsiales bacterium]|nr:alpha/beta hydrolase [Rickettsiales bacterium]